MSKISTARTVTIYKNGDTHFPGKKLVLNQREVRSIDILLDKVTRVVRNPVAVRSIRTPTNGTKVFGLEKLENGGGYVAVGPERFKKVQYADIQNQRVPWASKGPNDAPAPLPGQHNKFYSNVTARHKQVGEEEARRNRIITVYRNADENHAGIRMLLDKRTLLSIELVLEFITKKVKLQSGAVRKLYTLEGRLIDTIAAIQTGGQYVAVGADKKFKELDYPNLRIPSNITPRKMNPAAKRIKFKAAPKGKKKNQEAWEEHKVKKQSLAIVQIDENELNYNDEPLSPGVEDEPLSPRVDSDDNRDDSNDEDTADNNNNNDSYFDNLLDKIDDALDGDNSDSNEPMPSPSKRPVVETDPDKVFDRAVNSTKSKTSAQQSAAHDSDEAAEDELNDELNDEPTSWRKTATPAGSRLSQAGSRLSQASNRTRKLSDGDRKVSVANRKMSEPARKMSEADKKVAAANRKMSEPIYKMSDADRKVSEANRKMSEANRKVSEANRRGSSKARSIHEEAAADEIDEIVERSTENVKNLYDEEAEAALNDDIPEDSLEDAAGDNIPDDSIEEAANEDVPDALDATYDADNENDEPPAPGVYQASGAEAETAADVNDTGDTTVEQTIDELPAEEIEEEMLDAEGDDSQVPVTTTATDDDQATIAGQ